MSGNTKLSDPPIGTDELMLSAKAVCRRLSISRTTLWRLARNDETFPAPIKLSGHSVRYSWRSIEAWLRAKETKGRAL